MMFSIPAKRLDLLVISDPSTGLKRNVETEYGVRQTKQAKPPSENDFANGQIAVGITDPAST